MVVKWDIEFLQMKKPRWETPGLALGYRLRSSLIRSEFSHGPIDEGLLDEQTGA